MFSNKGDLQLSSTGSIYAYWEVFRYAEDGDIFEIIASNVSSYIGKRVVMKRTDSGIVMKNIGTYHDDSSDSLVIPYGAITGSNFKRVDEFVRMDTLEAIEMIKNDSHSVFIKDYGSFIRVTRGSDFSELCADTFADLFNTTFYKKG